MKSSIYPDPLPEIEVMRPGTFTDMSGRSVVITLADMQAMASRYDAAHNPAPVVLGHPEIDEPAYAWADYFRVEGDRLVASVSQANVGFVQSVRDGAYKRISLSLYEKDSPSNPKPGQFYPKHIGFLGAKAPAIKGLRSVAFGEQITTVAQTFTQPEEHIVSDTKNKIPENLEDKQPDAVLLAEQAISLAQALSALDEREAAIKAREESATKADKAVRHASAVSFAEALVGAGKLPPAQKDKIIYLAKALGDIPESAIAFGEGDAVERPDMVFKGLFAGAVPAIQFSELAAGGGYKADAAVSFASPSGHTMDPAALALHNKALALQDENKDLSYIDAVKRASAV